MYGESTVSQFLNFSVTCIICGKRGGRCGCTINAPTPSPAPVNPSPVDNNSDNQSNPNNSIPRGERRTIQSPGTGNPFLDAAIAATPDSLLAQRYKRGELGYAYAAGSNMHRPDGTATRGGDAYLGNKLNILGHDYEVTSEHGQREDPFRPGSGIMQNHWGLDMSKPIGTNADYGHGRETVHRAYDPVYGHYAIRKIPMPDGTFRYEMLAHLDSSTVGEYRTGNSGRSTGPHLHYELGTNWEDGRLTGHVDPYYFIQQNPNLYSTPVPVNQSEDELILSNQIFQVVFSTSLKELV